MRGPVPSWLRVSAHLIDANQGSTRCYPDSLDFSNWQAGIMNHVRCGDADVPEEEFRASILHIESSALPLTVSTRWWTFQRSDFVSFILRASCLFSHLQCFIMLPYTLHGNFNLIASTPPVIFLTPPRRPVLEVFQVQDATVALKMSLTVSIQDSPF